MTEVKIEPFDNEVSIKYKWAKHFEVPSFLILKTTSLGEKLETKYENFIDIVRKQINEGKSLKNIFDEFEDKIDGETIVMSYLYLKQPSEETLEEINELYSELQEDPIDDLEELKLELIGWQDDLRTDYRADMYELTQLESKQKKLKDLPGYMYSDFKIDRVILNMFPTLDSKKLTVDDAYFVFNDLVPTTEVPYIRYNGIGKDRQELIKIYRGKTDDEMPNYTNMVPSSSKVSKDNHFYFIVWTGKGKFTNATRESYLLGSWDLTSGLMSIKVPISNEHSPNVIMDKIKGVFPIEIDEVIQTNVNGEYFIYGLDVKDIYLVDMVLNTDLLNSYLFVKENTKPFAEKTQLKLFYRGTNPETESSLAVSLVQNEAQGGELITTHDQQKFSLTPNYKYVKANITKAESLDVAKKFMEIFSRLMYYYKSNEKSVEQEYINLIPELAILDVPIKPIKVGKKTAGSRIDTLKNVAPDVFVSGYARKCQKGLQPIVISDEQIPTWKNKYFVHKDVAKYRQVMKYPPKNPRLNFVCPDDTAPFPGVKANETLSNKDEYPYLPCCFKDDQMDPTSYSKYNQYYLGKVKEDKKSKSGHKIKTYKILGPDRFGYLPSNISKLVSTKDSKEIVRLGVPRSMNSFLHCVSMGVQDPNYLSSEDKEQYVTELRQTIANLIVPNLLKQELYDGTDEEIQNRLISEDFLDPNIFYRAIEETYNVNIFVFGPSKEDGKIELPRFKLFHSRSPRLDRTALLIYRTLGSESDSLDYPQCELIVDQDETENTVIYNFDPSINQVLYTALDQTYQSITWNIQDTPGQISTITGRSNLYSRINYYSLFGNTFIEQIVDGYGKARAFNLPTGNGTMTVVVPSSQPENLSTGSIHSIVHTTVVSILGNNYVGVTKNGNGLTDGLWYSVLDLKYGIYVPVVPTNLIDGEIGPSNPLAAAGINKVERIKKIRRDLDLILQIVKWLYLVSKLSLEDFIRTYLTFGTVHTLDSSTFYNFDNLGLKFPPSSNISEALNNISRLTFGLVKNNQVFLYSQKFYEGVIYWLKKYDKERKPAYPGVPTAIYRDNVKPEDFTSYPRIGIFVSEKDFKIWLNTLDKISFTNLVIQDKLNIKNSQRTEPYLYSDGSKIYLVQNVLGGQKPRAIQAAYNWYLTKNNPGYKANPFDGDVFPVNVVYGIGPSASLAVVENNAGTSTNYLQILNYGTEQYAALLPLL